MTPPIRYDAPRVEPDQPAQGSPAGGPCLGKSLGFMSLKRKTIYKEKKHRHLQGRDSPSLSRGEEASMCGWDALNRHTEHMLVPAHSAASVRRLQDS